MNFELFVDSAANLPDAIVKEHDIRVIPYSCIIDGTPVPAYDPAVPFRTLAKEFYAKLRGGADIKTSLINEADFEAALTPALEAGKDVFLITMTAGLSGANAQAQAAAATLKKKFPRRKIVVEDSSNASLGEGLLALRVAMLREMGESLEGCREWFEANRYRLNSQVTVDDLSFLHKSGRVSGVVAFAGKLLNIKPLLRANGTTPAKLVVCGKVKGRKKAISELLAAFDENVVDPASQTVAIAHADCEEDALALKVSLEERGVRECIVEYYDLCTSSHVGPGTLALFYMGKDRRGPQAEEKGAPAFGHKKAPARI